MKKIITICLFAILLTSCGVTQIGNLNRLSEGMTKAQVANIMGRPERTLDVNYYSDGVQEVLQYTTNYNEVYALEFWNNRLVGYEHLYDISSGYYGPSYGSGYYYYPSHPNYYERPSYNPRPPSNSIPPSNSRPPSNNYPGANTKPTPGVGPGNSSGRPNINRPSTNDNSNSTRPTTRPSTNNNNNSVRPTTRPSTNESSVRPSVRPSTSESTSRPTTRESAPSSSSEGRTRTRTSSR